MVPAAPPDADQESIIRYLTWVVAKRRVLIAVILVLVVVLGLAAWLSRPATYTAGFEFQYARRSPGDRVSQLLEQGLGRSEQDEAWEQEQILLSQSLLQDTLFRLGLLTPESPKEEAARRVDAFRGDIRIERDWNILRVHVRAGRDPDLALRLATTLKETYTAYDLAARQREDRRMQAFIVDELRRVTEEMARLRSLLDRFKERTRLTEEQEANVRRMEAIRTRFRQATGELTREKERLLALYNEPYPKVREVAVQLEFLRRVEIAESAEDLRAASRKDVMEWVGLRQELLDLARRNTVLEASIGEFDRVTAEQTGEQGDERFYQRKLAGEEDKFANLNRKLAQVDLSLNGATTAIQMLKDPDVARRVGDRPLSTVFAFLVALGLLVGLGTGLTAEHLDTSLVTAEDVEHHVHARVLGDIPAIQEHASERRAGGLLIADASSRSVASDAYRMLLTKLLNQVSPGEGAAPVLLVTSSVAQEGKSTTSANLGVTAAELGYRTVIVSCNLRRPTVGAAFDVAGGPGVADVLAGSARWVDAFRKTAVENLFIVVAGNLPPDSSALLARRDIAELFGMLRKKVDLVIVDSPPVLLVTDALLLAPMTDGALLVYSAGSTDKRSLLRASGALADGGVHFLGVVLNHKQGMPGSSYRRYYGKPGASPA